MLATFNIRKATLADAPGIAKVHVETWRSTYRGMVPDEHLDRMSCDRSASRMQVRFADPDAINLVAESATDGIVGFAFAGPSQDGLEPELGELHALYVLQNHQGKGLGRRLLKASADALRERGFQGMKLWVIRTNSATAFYERMGGVREGAKTFSIGGAEVPVVSYAWNDLSQLCRDDRD